MEDLFDPASAERLRLRILSVSATSERQWGTMSAAQMLEHCARTLAMATGDSKPPRPWLNSMIGRIIKPLVLREGEPMRRNVPTIPSLIVPQGTDVDAARATLLQYLDRFAGGGPAACTTHPHPFFGRLTPQEWSRIMHKHLDHHLRQFSA